LLFFELSIVSKEVTKASLSPSFTNPCFTANSAKDVAIDSFFF
jgi:hypothetical protein